MRFISTIILLAILYFSGMALWSFIGKQNAINEAAKQSSEAVIKLDTNSTLTLENTFYQSENSNINQLEVADSETEIINGITQQPYPYPYPYPVKRLDRKVIAELEQKYAKPENQVEQSRTITEVGSTPAERIVAKVHSPLSFISYELNSVSASPDGNLHVTWKLKNTSDQEIFISRDLRRLLSPTRLYVVDFKTQRRFAIKYDKQVPVANCMLTDSISPMGRVDCSALVGPVLRNNGGLEDNKVLVYLPGKATPVRVFLNI